MSQRKQLEQLLDERIVILDGAMGTSIQELKFSEEDFRGKRFEDWPTPLKGNNDLLTLTQPESIAAIHRNFLEAGADIITIHPEATNDLVSSIKEIKSYNKKAGVSLNPETPVDKVLPIQLWINAVLLFSLFLPNNVASFLLKM